MLTIGVLVCGVLTILMGIAFLILKDGSGVVNPWASGAIIVSMFVFRGVFGLSVGPVTLLYIPEIVEMNIVAISTMLNLFTAALVTLTFPIARKLLGNNPGPIFLFYGLYSLLSSALNAWLVVESKDSPEFTIRHSFEHKLQALRTL